MTDTKTPPELRRQVGRVSTLHVDIVSGVYVCSVPESGMICVWVRENTKWYPIWRGTQMDVLMVLLRRIGIDLHTA